MINLLIFWILTLIPCDERLQGVWLELGGCQNCQFLVVLDDHWCYFGDGYTESSNFVCDGENVYFGYEVDERPFPIEFRGDTLIFTDPYSNIIQNFVKKY